MTRVYAVSDSGDLEPAYAEGLRAAVSSAVDYGLAAVELGEERAPPPPPILLAQARLAARAGVGLDTVLRRYFAGHALLGDFLVAEAEGGRLLRGAALQRLLRTQAALFDRLLAAISDEHRREGCAQPGSSEQRRAERIERLLAGELVDASELGYQLEGWHLGVLAEGPAAEEALRALASSLDRRMLKVCREEGAVWAWLGGRRPFDLEGSPIEPTPSPGTILAIGEPAEGLSGWRLTHLQATAALPIARRGSEPLVRYRDVARLASMLKDELLAISLREIYLKPLERERDSGRLARETLRAYFAAGCNASAAAAAMGVNRETVSNRLRTIEQRFGRPFDSCAADVEAALRLEELGVPIALQASSPIG